MPDTLTVKLTRKYYDDKIFFRKASVEFEQGITVLVGCNGYGKTTMLNSIAAHCRVNKIPCIEFDSIRNRRNDRDRTTLDGDMGFLATFFCSSEGEQISLSVGKFARKLGDFIRKNSDKDELVVLFDALDSGYSIDNIVEVKEFLTDTVMRDCAGGGKLYIIISANSYELVSGERCIDPIKCEPVSFNNYEQYRKYILNTRKIKDKR